ncbi:hypothetical protein GCM10022225_18010 [Plantactinospora mayteni]|uniref:N-acetyltransferase domain-containing protein n=1 Tax=Plantactinospora mayteni TaxID=566021 RepID=A0ABQ4EGU6_9ACTN|nr:GNAT family N-acetyltransferase [Plantactinospora mayteni]GIG93874.1 hypothetical protein Pma05_04470 [Plantactinospora mayteni]
MPALVSPTQVEDVRRLDARTGAEVVALLASSVPPTCAGLVPYHAAGYAGFLAAAVAPPTALRTVRLRAIRVATAVIAVADWRLLDSQLFLNGLAVRDDHRGRGYGSALLTDGLRLAADLGLATLGLDVVTDNAPARSLYRRFGFRDLDYAVWTDIPAADLERSGDAGQVGVLDWPAFTAHHAAYGFGDLSVRRGDNRVGRIRLVGTALRTEPGPAGAALAGALRRLVQPSRSYSIRPAGTGSGDDGFAHVARMRLSGATALR